jgi:uncharacterized membrane-anchored protein YjiN (DUF445 family)
MKHTKNKLQTQQQTLSKSIILKQSSRAVTLKGVWNSTEITFKGIESDGGIPLCKSILAVEIARMVFILKADMQEAHIDYLVNYIIQHYYSYTISDITCITDRLVKNNPYGKPILQNIIHELDQYSIEKQEFAVTQRIKENSKHKAEHLKDDKFTKMYARLKAEAKEPKKTQKQKDAENKAKNEERIKELEKKGWIIR